MGEAPSELAIRSHPSISESERVDPYLRQYDAFLETTTQMLATPKLNERLLLALEGIENIFGHRQAAIAIINERDAELRVRAAVGFEDDSNTRVEMPLDSSANCVRVLYVGADENSIDPVSLTLLNRFADKLGIIASLAIHQERLVNTVTKLQRER